MKKFYVHIHCSKRNVTLYTGVTSDIVKRVYEHKHGLIYMKVYVDSPGFLLPQE